MIDNDIKNMLDEERQLTKKSVDDSLQWNGLLSGMMAG